MGNDGSDRELYGVVGFDCDLNVNDENDVDNNDLKLGWAMMEVTGSSME